MEIKRKEKDKEVSKDTIKGRREGRKEKNKKEKMRKVVFAMPPPYLYCSESHQST
jgi:hypothetical protein